MGAIFFLLICLTAPVRAENLTLLIGQSRAFAAAHGEPVHVRGSKAVAIADTDNQIVVTGKSGGHAEIQVGAKKYEITVTSRDNHGLFGAIREALRTRLGLKAEMIGGRVTITGHLHRLRDWIELSEIAERLNTEFVFRARIDDDIKDEVHRHFRDLLLEHNLPLPNFVWSPVAQAIIAEEDKHSSHLWNESLGPYGVDRVYEKAEMAIKPLVRVKIVVAEVNNKARQKLGIDWPTSVSAHLAPKWEPPAQLDVALQALETRGLGQILASPNLLARSGSEAEFLAGGEFPVRVATKFYQEVTWKRHGIYLKIKPVADFSGRLSVELTTEVSLLDMATTVEGIPSLKINRITTHFDLAEARTIVLSGLIRNDWGKDSAGLPYLSRIPVIGKLFGSDDFNSLRSELVVFVTPEIVNVRDEDGKIKFPANWQETAP
jgi:pilus assembly protein CpaC